jgi:hypothetical protein
LISTLNEANLFLLGIKRQRPDFHSQLRDFEPGYAEANKLYGTSLKFQACAVPDCATLAIETCFVVCFIKILVF